MTGDRPFFSPMKCEMANFFLVNRDFQTAAVRRDFANKIFRETRNKCSICREP